MKGRYFALLTISVIIALRNRHLNSDRPTDGRAIDFLFFGIVSVSPRLPALAVMIPILKPGRVTNSPNQNRHAV